MWTGRTTSDDRQQRLKEYDRLMLRSAFASLFWVALSERRRRGKFTFKDLARLAGTSKSVVSRWFSGDQPPNWEVDSIADIAGALDIELRIEAIDRATGAVLSPTGARAVTEAHSADAPQVTATTEATSKPQASSPPNVKDLTLVPSCG